MSTQVASTRERRVGPYVLERMLGEGGQGAVWLARREGRPSVALKVLRPGFAGDGETARLRREMALLSSFTDPGLPRPVEMVEDEGTMALAMSYIEGRPLSEVAREGLSPEQVLLIVREVARILSVLHARGVMHRDVKPANLLLRQGWQAGAPGGVVLVDLGIARGAAHTTTLTGAAGNVGTLGFMAPELLLGDAREAAQHPRIDVYALGCLGWLLLTGHLPCGLQVTASLTQLLALLMQRQPPIIDAASKAQIQARAPGLLGALERFVILDPSVRPQSASEALALLPSAPAPQQLAPTSHPTPTPGPASGWTAMAPPAAANAYTAMPAAVPPIYQNTREAPTQMVPRPAPRWPFVVGGLVVLGGGGLLAIVIVAALVIGGSSRASSRPPVSTPAQQPVTTPQPVPTSTVVTRDTQQRIWVVLPPGHTFASLRQAPDLGSSEIERLNHGDMLDVVDASGVSTHRFYRVRAPSGRVGFMHRDILTGSPPGAPRAPIKIPGKK